MPERQEPELGKGMSSIFQNFISDFLKELTERFQKMEEVLVIDRIEGDLAVCENRKDGKIKNIPISQLPKNIKDGSILKWNNGKYEVDVSNEIENRIENKMKNVWK